MPYLRISYTAPADVWVKIGDGEAHDPDCWDDLCDVVNSDAEVEHAYSGPHADLPEGVRLRADLT